MQVDCRVPTTECDSHKVIKTRWVDTNIGDERSPDVRCQLEAKEVNEGNNTQEESENFFASTPLREAVKFLFSKAMTGVLLPARKHHLRQRALVESPWPRSNPFGPGAGCAHQNVPPHLLAHDLHSDTSHSESSQKKSA